MDGGDEKSLKLREGFRLLQLMKADILTALRTEQSLVIEGEDALGAMLTVIQIAEKATAEELAGRIEERKAAVLDPSGNLAQKETDDGKGQEGQDAEAAQVDAGDGRAARGPVPTGDAAEGDREGDHEAVQGPSE